MRLLFLTNFYPPASRGGYELWCQEVAEHLGRAGHDLVVLTSRAQVPPDPPARGVRVARELYLEMEIDSRRNVPLFFFERGRRTRANLDCASRLMGTFQPDFVVIWGMWNLTPSLAALAEQVYGQHTVYYFGDYWPTLPSQWKTFWTAPARGRISAGGKWLLKNTAHRLLEREAPPVLGFPHALFPTEFMRRRYESEGIRVGQSRVVLGGARTEPYRRQADQRRDTPHPERALEVLVAGRLTEDKGIHTALEAIALLAKTNGSRRWALTIVGTGDAPYIGNLKQLAERLGIADLVHFAGAVPPDALPQIMSRHHMFVFPSIWDEPFGRVLVEAMAAGLPVIGTAVGGAAEILRDGETGLVFAPGDASALARQLDRLAASPDLFGRLARQGQATAVATFDSGRMAREIQAYLEDVARRSDPDASDERFALASHA